MTMSSAEARSAGAPDIEPIRDTPPTASSQQRVTGGILFLLAGQWRTPRHGDRDRPSGIAPREIGISTPPRPPIGDLGELAAIRTLFGSDGGIAVSATKSATEHLLGTARGLGAHLCHPWL
jgi:hypothetical protein